MGGALLVRRGGWIHDREPFLPGFRNRETACDAELPRARLDPERITDPCRNRGDPFELTSESAQPATCGVQIIAGIEVERSKLGGTSLHESAIRKWSGDGCTWAIDHLRFFVVRMLEVGGPERSANLIEFLARQLDRAVARLANVCGAEILEPSVRMDDETVFG